MKKKFALSTITIVYIVLLLAINISLLIYILLKIYTRSLLAKHLSIILYCLLLDVILSAIYYYTVVIPYMRIKNLYRMFLKGQIYEELFRGKYSLTPELVSVMDRFHYLLNKQDAINISQKQAEYLALQNQINPHFLYNTLEAIRGDALREEMPNIAAIAEALAAFFRYTITDVGNLVTLEAELENVENYFIIQRYRFGDKFKLTINLPENEEDIMRLQMPKLTLQPIVENAIFHGLEGKSEGGHILVNLETTKNNLYISIIDDGLGIAPNKLEKINDYLERVAVSYVSSSKKESGGIALKNVSRRIKLLFGDEYGIHIYSTLNLGTDVRITLPKILDS